MTDPTIKYMASNDKAWEEYGRSDPYFGVLSDDRFRDAGSESEARREFFASGEATVGHVLNVARTHLGMDRAPRRTLDFGCGVGRLVIPFAAASEQVVGVDVSQGMLDEARENCRTRGITNVELVRSADPSLASVPGTFDFVHSYIVFQHIVPATGEAILRSILRKLEDGGRGALHFTYARRAPVVRKAVHRLRRGVPLTNGLVNLAQRRPWAYPFMAMHEYRLDRLFDILREEAADHMHLALTDHAGHLGAMIFFRKGAREGAL